MSTIPTGPSGLPGPTGPRGPQGPSGPGATPSKPPTQSHFAVGQTTSPGVPAPIPQKSPLDRATYERISKRIRESASQSGDPSGVLALVVEDELKRVLGEQATAEMARSVCEHFRTHPDLQGLWAKLSKKALA